MALRAASSGGGVSVAGSAGQFQYSDGSALAAAPLWREDANTVAQRNGTTGQSYYIYNTYTDASNYERGYVRWNANLMEVGQEKAGSGANRNVRLTAGGSAEAQVLGAGVRIYSLGTSSNTWLFDSAGSLRAASSTYNIGTNTATNCPGNIWAATQVEAPRMKTTATTVGSLTAAATAGAGARAFVTDADSSTFGAAAVGGSTNKMPVWCDGSGWFIG